MGLLHIHDIGTWEGKFFVGIIGFSWATYIWEEYLSYRQRCVYIRNVTPPKKLSGIVDDDTFSKSRAYNLDKSYFGVVEGAFNQVLSTAVMVAGGFPFLWDLSEKFLQWFGFEGSGEIPQTLVFVSLGSVISSVLSLPWSAYFTFKVEQKHGFNKQTPLFFIKDKIKKLVVSQLIAAPVVAGLVYIIRAGGDYFFVYLWGFTTVVMLFFMTVYPDYIAPLFDKYEPLPEGELRSKIEAMASSIKFPLTKLYVVQGSKRSAHSNAYLYGFFNNKRIVLYDTLLEEYTPLNEKSKVAFVEEELLLDESCHSEDKVQSKTANTEDENKTGCKTEEVLAVIGHELGHWKLNHVVKNIVISQVNLLLLFFVFGSLYQYAPLYRAFGFRTQPAFIGLIIVMQYVFAPYNEVLGVLMTVMSRQHEFQADGFAKELGYAKKLKSALLKLEKDNLGFPVYDWLFSAWHHSHPPVLERINALEEKPKQD